MSFRRPTLQEIVNSAVAKGLRDLYTCAPAKVVKFDASNQRANCQILVKNVTEGEDESRQVTSWPVVPGVPVQFLGAGGFRITCPISDGTQSAATTGTLFWSHRSLDKWLSGTGGEVDPELDHDHALTDAIFIPGLMPFGAAWSNVSTSKMTIGNNTTPSDIEIDTSGNVVVANGSNGAARVGDPCQIDSIASGGLLSAWMNQVEVFVNGLVPGTVAPLSAAIISSPGITIKTGSTKVKLG